MPAIALVRRAGVLLLLGGSGAFAQTALPATTPTANAVSSPASAANGTEVTGASPTGHRAQVVYARGQLQITADDSSLNQILRDIGRQTGMKITGNVNDDRVYGTYGPASPNEILERLLEGSGSNMVLRETAERAPAELILTPRVGGITPPNPNARNYDDDAATEPAPPPAPARQEEPVPQQSPGSAPNPTPGGPGAAAESRQSPNGVQTPQQVFEQLQRLQQTQQQQSNPQ